MSRKLRIAAAQLGAINLADTRPAVVKRLLALLQEAASMGAKFVVFPELAFTSAHAREAGALPRHHGDPFDRALIAQARTDGLVLVTADPALQAYLALDPKGPPRSAYELGAELFGRHQGPADLAQGRKRALADVWAERQARRG